VIFRQHYLGCLSHPSYLIGGDTTGRAVVVDPRRDIGVYLEEAAAQGLRIERVIETHLHADFLSGHLELAEQTGAVISFGEAAEVEFPTEPLVDGQRIELGEVTLESAAKTVVVCRSGGRSAAITQMLTWRGFDAVNLAGGMRAWAEAGLPVLTGGGEPGRII
jgi:rhodanese-related sulfurtransferase